MKRQEQFQGTIYGGFRIGPLTLVLLIALVGLGFGSLDLIFQRGAQLNELAYSQSTLKVSSRIQHKKSLSLISYMPDVKLANNSSVNMAPVYSRVPTSQPVIFLGIDDGWVKNPDAKKWLVEHKLPFTLFLTNDAIKDNYDFFKQLQASGMNIQNHTLHHPNLTKMSFQQQKFEICAASDLLTSQYGKRPTLFRPPFGAYNDDTRRAVSECGMKALVLWHAKADGGGLQFQDVGHFLPGDIILMHFRPKFIQDMSAFMKEVDSQHLVVGNLEDWL